MKVVACYKIVPYEQNIRVNEDRSIRLAGVENIISQYDLNAVEAGARLVENHGGELIALTVGTAEVENSKLRKSILSRGPAKCVAVRDDTMGGADSCATSAALAKAVKSIGEFDLVICGEGSSDLYAQQVGIQLGERLGLPTINGIIGIEAEDSFIILQRSVDSEVETLKVCLPAVISVSSSINIPRIPGMKEILAAGKKPFSLVNGDELKLPSERLTVTRSVLAPEQSKRAGRVFNGDDTDTVAAFADAISAELK